jgi:predicted anti-sigma-YlaC factor YlaD
VAVVRDSSPMGCEAWREALSARLDGEDVEGGGAAAVDAHLAECTDCTDWARRLERMHRAARVAPAVPVPDLTEAILAAAAAEGSRWGLGGLGWSMSLTLRWALVVLAALEIGMAAPEFAAGWHAGGELGTWAVASAVGLLSVAAKPRRAGAVLPMLAAASVITLVVSTRDVVGGRAVVSAEWPHLLLVGGVLVMVAIWRREREGDPPGPDTRIAPNEASERERIRRGGRRAA